MAILNKNKKITGKRINSVIGKASMVGSEYVPLDGVTTYIAPDHVSMIRMGAKGNPAMGIEGEGSVWLSPLKGTFKPDEVGEIEVRNDRMYITMGKNQYWFRIKESKDQTKQDKTGNLQFRTEFEMDPSQLAAIAKKAYYVTFETGFDKDGSRMVFITFHDIGGFVVERLDLKTSWKGEPSTSMYPADRIADWDKLGKKAKARMGNDFLIRLSGEDEGVQYEYSLAPRIESDNKKPLPRNKNVIEMDRQRILSIYGTPERFRNEVDSIDAPSVPDAIYAMFASCGNSYPRWMISDYLATVLGPDYKSYGSDEYDVYAKLMARDGMEIYRTARVVSANRKGRARSKR